MRFHKAVKLRQKTVSMLLSKLFELALSYRIPAHTLQELRTYLLNGTEKENMAEVLNREPTVAVRVSATKMLLHFRSTEGKMVEGMP